MALSQCPCKGLYTKDWCLAIVQISLWQSQQCDTEMGVWWIRKRWSAWVGDEPRGETKSVFRFIGEALLFPFLHLLFCRFLFEFNVHRFSTAATTLQFGHLWTIAIKLYLILWGRGQHNEAYALSLKRYTVVSFTTCVFSYMLWCDHFVDVPVDMIHVVLFLQTEFKKKSSNLSNHSMLTSHTWPFDKHTQKHSTRFNIM